MKLGMQVDLGPGHIVLDGDSPSNTMCPGPLGTQLLLPQRRTTPQFLANICCGQMAAWIKMPRGIEVGLGPGDFVLAGEPAPPSQKGVEPPNFLAHVYCGQMAR